MNNFPDQYDTDAEERRLVAEYVERDTKEGIEQYSRIFASMVGLKVFEDWPPSERRRAYFANPPVDPTTGGPPPDIEGLYPQWTQLSQIDAGYYQERVEDFYRLTKDILT